MRRADPRVEHRRPDLSQHFLRDGAARRLVRHLSPASRSTVLEAGAGDGAITRALAGLGCHIVAIEKDERLYRALAARMAPLRNVRCVHADFLDAALPSTPYAVVSNVPFGITAALIRKLLHAARPPDEALLVLQREAAQKFAGTPRETRFSLLNKPFFELAILGALRRSDFDPPPRVSSVVLWLRRRERPLLTPHGARAYASFINATFGHGSPEVTRALRRYLTSRQVRRLGRDLGFAQEARASQLTFGQWLAIFRFVEHECLGHDPTRDVAA
jgi:23S rRNA (adenine-N6)-dimethyltransferase